jgi:uncharacterized protein YyaL (SSP411 family)
VANRLASARSLYLRQHAGNPVDWWPWCEEALGLARMQQRPVLLSIGYSACHWCHVMAHESFEDEATARVMNALFVNIKVDREERPDLDHVYQAAHQALTGRPGGWPLTVFLDPENLLPFFAGTYFPPQPRHGLPGFADLVQRVREWYDAHPGERGEQAAQLGAWLASLDAHAPGEIADEAPLRTAFTRWRADFDAEYGGHAGAPKFPHAGELHVLLDTLDADAADARTMLLGSLRGMLAGGLFDQIGGGFFRYSVDARWEIPHFEKMLYDNAQLLDVYARAARRFGDADFGAAAHAAFGWLQREMHLSGGGYAAALDADSEGGEGASYLWPREEVRAQLDADDYAIAALRFGLDREPNFEHQAWHLTARVGIAEMATRLGHPPGEMRSRLDNARQRLLEARLRRPQPARDDKLVCSWNAMTIAALARSARYLGATGFAAAADTAMTALRRVLWYDDRLHRASSSDVTAFLDDHAALLDALLELLALRWRDDDLAFAIAIADHLLDDFEDRDSGGFFYAPRMREKLPQRGKPVIDESLPSGNGIAIHALLRLGRLLGDTRYLDAAERGLRAAHHALDAYPEACAALLRALHAWLRPSPHVVVCCRRGEETPWRTALAAATREIDAWVIPDDAANLPAMLDARRMTGDGTAWLCEGMTCRAPLASPEELRAALAELPPA